MEKATKMLKIELLAEDGEIITLYVNPEHSWQSGRQGKREAGKK